MANLNRIQYNPKHQPLYFIYPPTKYVSQDIIKLIKRNVNQSTKHQQFFLKIISQKFNEAYCSYKWTLMIYITDIVFFWWIFWERCPWTLTNVMNLSFIDKHFQPRLTTWYQLVSLRYCYSVDTGWMTLTLNQGDQF